MPDTATEAVLRRDRSIVAGGLVAITVLCWIYLLVGAGIGASPWEMSGMAPSGGDGVALMRWTPVYWVLMVLMWWIMMIAMMAPSAAPTILLYARVHRHEQRKHNLAPGIVPTSLFAGGYLAVWLGFSVLATVLQFMLEQVGLMSGMTMWSVAPWLSAAVLAAAGIYQFTPIKQACLAQCRRPADFLAGHWRPGRLGAFLMGCDHGAFCVACCWGLMGLLFVGGVMNLLWIAGLTVFVLIEKVVPRGERLARVAGAGCLVAAVWIVVGVVASV